MSITFPTFVDKEIVTPEKLNNFVQAIEAKFTAGLGTAEIQWPLIAGGNLIMGEYEITGGRKIFNVVNAAEYPTLQAALTAGSGGLVYIPPGTTIQADGAELVGATCAIVGAGPSSVLKMADAPAAAYLLRNNSMGSGTRFMIANLTFDGNSEAGGGGLLLRDAKSAIVHGCYFKNWTGAALLLTNGTGSADSTDNVQVTDCFFEGGADHHIQGVSCDNVIVKGCVSDNCDTKAIEFVAGDSSSLMRSIKIVDNIITACDEEMIRVMGGSGTPSALWTNVVVSDNQLDGTGGSTYNAMTIGGSSTIIAGFTVADNVIMNALDDGISVAANDGIVSGNIVEDCGSDAVEMANCARVKVCDNYLRSAGAYGVSTDNCDDCSIHDNDVTDAVSGGVQLASTNGTFTQYHNLSQFGVPPVSAYVNMDYTTTGAGVTTESNTITIPANTLKAGDILRVTANAFHSGSFGAGGSTLRLDDGSEHTLGVGTTYYAGDDVAIVSDVVITSATHMKVIYHGLNKASGNNQDINDNSFDVDLTTAIEIFLDMAPTGTDTLTSRGIVVRVMNAEQQ